MNEFWLVALPETWTTVALEAIEATPFTLNVADMVLLLKLTALTMIWPEDWTRLDET